MSDARSVAAEVAADLGRAGHVAWFAGGCVRDRLLGLEPKDYDVATDAVPTRVAELFPGALRVGEAFGVMLVRRGGHSIEVATFRRDGTYADGRRPDEVSWSSPEEDAARRDFTINGLFEDPATGEVIDHVGGQADLAAGVLRAIGTADDRIEEDRLRMLRAARFAARFDFDVEPRTAEAIRRRAAGLTSVSRERIGHEFRAMLGHPNRAAAATLLHDLRLLAPVFAGLGPIPGPPGRRLGRLPADATFPTAVAAWMLDADDRTAGGAVEATAAVGGRIGASRTAFAAAEAAIAADESAAAPWIEAWRDALILSNAEDAAIRRRLATRAALLAGGPPSSIKPRLAGADPQPAIDLIAAESPAVGARAAADVRRLAASGIDPAPILTGDHLRTAGMTPGPVFRRLIGAARAAQLDGRIRTSAEALDLAGRLAVRSDDGAAGGPAPRPTA